MPFAAFGPGILIATRTDLATPLAINVGFAQELSIDFAGNTKKLYGQKQFPLVAARSTYNATAKFKAAEVSGIAWNAVMFGQSFQSGGYEWAIDSTANVPASTAYTIQASTLFEQDLGLWYSTAGLPGQRVAGGSEAAGKYSVDSSGLYSFAAADAGKAVKLTYTKTTATGQMLRMTNPNIGDTPTLQLDYYTSLNQPTAKPFVVRLYQLVAGKLSMAFKLEDFMIPEFDCDIFARSSDDRVFDMVYPEIS